MLACIPTPHLPFCINPACNPPPVDPKTVTVLQIFVLYPYSNSYSSKWWVWEQPPQLVQASPPAQGWESAVCSHPPAPPTHQAPPIHLSPPAAVLLLPACRLPLAMAHCLHCPHSAMACKHSPPMVHPLQIPCRAPFIGEMGVNLNTLHVVIIAITFFQPHSWLQSSHIAAVWHCLPLP